VSIAYPPDTDTPGFVEERKTKPVENRACFPDDPYKAEEVAEACIYGFLKGDYHVQSPDFLQNLLVQSMTGVSPRINLVLEMLLAPLIYLVNAAIVLWFDYQAGKYARKQKSD